MKSNNLSACCVVLSSTIIIAALIASILSPALATASTYYVATNGANSNPGTQTSPFRTIVKGLSVMSMGDILFIRGGTYAETLDANIVKYPVGTSWNNAPQIKGYPGEIPIIQPTGDMGPASFTSANPYLVQYLIFDGLVFDGTNVKGNGLTLNGSKYIRVQNGEIRNFRYSKGGAIHFSATQGISQFNEFINLKIYNNGTLACCLSGEVGHGIYGSSVNTLFDRLEVYNNGGWGMQFYSSGGGINNNTVRNSIFRNNGVVVSSSGGLYMGSGTNNLAYNNLIYDNSGYGLFITDSNQKAYNNTIYGNGLSIGANGVYISGVNTDFRNNIVYNNGAVLLDQGSGTTSSNTLTSNPLFVDPASSNFHLQSSSPAVDKGIKISIVTNDFAGILRPQGVAYDIGAYEFSQLISQPITSPANLRTVPQ